MKINANPTFAGRKLDVKQHWVQLIPPSYSDVGQSVLS
jgi:hypothetical protein